MKSKKVLVTGGKGLLATHLRKHLEAIYVDVEEMDITNRDSVKTALAKYQPEVVLHLAAYTDLGKAESDKMKCYHTNVTGTELLALRVPRFIYMSTEYVFDGEKGNYHENHIPNPVNFYSLTKLLGEFAASKAKRYSVIRTLFKPNPYKHSSVPTDMWTSGDYVEKIAPLIALAVKNEATLPKVIHIGTGRKNLFELALQTRKVDAIKRSSCPIRLPRDTSLDTTLWDNLKYGRQE